MVLGVCPLSVKLAQLPKTRGEERKQEDEGSFGSAGRSHERRVGDADEVAGLLDEREEVGEPPAGGARSPLLGGDSSLKFVFGTEAIFFVLEGDAPSPRWGLN